MIRFCPNCRTERPLTELFCEGTVDGQACHWDLSGVDIRAPGTAPPSPPLPPPSAVCPNGHPISVGDLICPVCESAIESTEASPHLEEGSAAPYDAGAPSEETVIEGWRLTVRLPASSAVRERFVAVRASDARQAVLTLYAPGSEPDPTIYAVLEKLPRGHIVEVIATGRWQDRAFEVTEHLSGGNFSSIVLSPGDLGTIRQVVQQLGQALHAFSEAGLRHRDLRPGVVLARSREPLDLAITGFGSARLSEFDLDVVSPLETTRYMAPEAVAGGVAAASDWWSLGMLLLESFTQSACFEGVNDQAFLIHVLAGGAPIPQGIDPSLDVLLRGLLARDRRERWQWNEIRAWLAGETVSAPELAVRPDDLPAGAAITLAGKAYRTSASFALAAAEATNWDEAREHLLRGVVAGWAEEAGLDAKLQAALRQVGHAHELHEDLRLSIALKVLHPGMPLVVRGNMLTPGWLLDHPEEGYALITGPAPDHLRRFEAEDWLARLKTRADAVRARARQLDITLIEEEVRVHLLSTSITRLATLWEERRKLLPDTDHPGLASLMERRQTAEEDLILLLGASTGQFRPAAEVVEEAAKDASRAGIRFDALAAGEHLLRARREIYRTVDDRIANFSRCGIEAVDDWADQFRLDRRMPLSRALALLSVPKTAWKELPKQGYVSAILDFFGKKISGAVLRGPLARMIIGKSSARVDLVELGTARSTAADILQQLLARTSRNVNIDPATFAASDNLERRLRALHSHALLYRRDTGIDGLYLGFPFLLMRDPRGNIRPRIAPVLLWPVRINPEVGNRGHVTLGFGREHDADRDPDQIILNPAFEGLMGFDAARRWQEAADELLTRASISVGDVVDAFSTLATPRGRELARLPGKDVDVQAYRPELSPSAVLFHLTFMGQAVVKDLDHLKGRPPAGTGLETALRLGEPKSESPGSPRPRELEKFFTTDSDPSQEAAVMEARFYPGLVVEGPPGTGKSQTIVNMVADSIGRGKSLLVICQKQAALEVVRKRLEKENLGNRFVMLTDVNRDREPIVRAIRAQVEALHARPPGGAPAWQRQRERLAPRIEALEGELDRHQAAMHRVDGPTGLTYRTLLGELLALEAERPEPLSIPALRSQLSKLHPSEVATLEEACAPLAKYWLPAKYEDSPLWVLNSFSPDRGTLELFLEAFKGLVKAEASRKQVNAESEDSFAIEDDTALRSWLTRHENDFRSLAPALCSSLARCLHLFRHDRESHRGTAIIVALDETVRALNGLDGSAHGEPISPRLRALPDEQLAQIKMLSVAATKPIFALGRMNPARWRRRSKLRKILASMNVPADAAGMLTCAAAAQLEASLRPLRRRVNAASKELLDRVTDEGFAPAHLAGFASNLRAVFSKMGELAAAIDECPFADELELSVRSGALEAIEAFFTRVERSLARFNARKASLAKFDSVAPYFDAQWLEPCRAAVKRGASNGSALEQIVDSLPTLEAYQEFRIRGAHLGDREFAIFGALRTKEPTLSTLDPAELDACVRRTIAREARFSWKLRIEASVPEILLDSDAINDKIKALADADMAIRRCNRELLVDGIDASRIGAPREWEAITRLRGQRSLRLREFIDKSIEHGLMTLRPIWLMTPDVASRVLLPKAGMFDTVIYDEASQMPVEYSLPTLFRSKTVVVSGDEKQMPPTAFFSSKVENDEAATFDGEEPDDSAPEEERDAFVETWNRREIKDCPDLLHLARVVLPTRTLQVHYRSAYRELIAFSNASFYSNRLSVPVQHPDNVIREVRPIEVIRSDGLYKSQTNAQEAADVVTYLAKLWKMPSPPSVGVVTFNRKQTDEIEDAIEEYAERDRAFRDALMRERERTESGEDMGFFVKNVENVQGDERDVVVFSTTFGRNGQGAFRRNFGVLGQAGGERRLNVAVTRARQKVVLVTSMPVEEISDMLTTHKRPAVPRDYLQAYLEYARMVSDGLADSGRALLGRLVTERRAEHDGGLPEHDGFTEAVERSLREWGWEPVPAHDGGAFGLDFAIEHPRTGLYAIGIECDAPRHRILETARAREVWRPSVLRQAVPYVHRVSSRGWMHAGNAERSRLQAAVEHALKA
ncbi:MAG: DUF4011 domain-containing protein [Hyphomicrobiales bacterium]|nr:DUF4011 domain-containing protein [Hyphomicrobiales bacterium]